MSGVARARALRIFGVAGLIATTDLLFPGASADEIALQCLMGLAAVFIILVKRFGR